MTIASLGLQSYPELETMLGPCIVDTGLRVLALCVLLGLVLAAFMAAFDVAVGRWVMRKPWAKIWPDFNPATGNYLLYAALFLACVPLLLGWVSRRL